jgi:hypothetical protein
MPWAPGPPCSPGGRWESAAGPAGVLVGEEALRVVGRGGDGDEQRQAESETRYRPASSRFQIVRATSDPAATVTPTG